MRPLNHSLQIELPPICSALALVVIEPVTARWTVCWPFRYIRSVAPS